MKQLKAIQKNTSNVYIMFCLSDEKLEDFAFIETIKSFNSFGIIWKRCGITILEVPKKQEDYIRKRMEDLKYKLVSGTIISVTESGAREEFYLKGKNFWTIVN